MVGTVTLNGEIHNLRDYPFRDDDDDLIVPLADGSNIVCKGAYPISINFDGLDMQSTDLATIELTTRYETRV